MENEKEKELEKKITTEKVLLEQAEGVNTQLSRVPFVIKLACVLISLIALVYISIIGKSILVPLIIGFLISMLLLPLSNFMERKLKFPRIVTSLISPIIFVLGVLGLGYLIGTQVAKFTDDIPEFQKQVEELFHKGTDFVNEKFGVSESEQIQYINKNAETTIKKGSEMVGGMLLSVTSTLAASTFVFLYIFFFLLYRSHLVKFVVWCFRPEHQKQVREVVSSVQSIIKQYIFGLMIQILFIAAALMIAFSIIGIKYAFLFAILCAVLNLIPYIGIFSATVLAALVTLTTGEPIDVLWVIISVVVVNSIDGNIITPKVIGSKVSLNSFVVLFGIIVAESIWGIAGMFLAIPLLAIFKIIFDNVIDLRPYGFLLGEDDAPTPLFEKYYDKYFYRRKPKDSELPRALQTEEQNHQEFEDNKSDDSK
jgi:predicted PurR-regulated permease PerM